MECGGKFAKAMVWMLAFFGAVPVRSQSMNGSLSPIVLIQIRAAGDSFVMGDGTYGPDVTESVSYHYQMSKYEITHSQFAAFVAGGGYDTVAYWTTAGWAWKGGATQPRHYTWGDGRFNAPNQPVLGISWYEAVAFCNWLSTMEGLSLGFDSAGRPNLAASGYRLPTVVEWEYAASKGAPNTPERVYPWGDTWNPSMTVCDYPATSVPAAVGSKSPGGDTPQELADMAGNAWELCSDGNYSRGDVVSTTDWFHDVGTTQDQWILAVGGGWGNPGGGTEWDANGGGPREGLYRCAYRLAVNVGSVGSLCGFRVVRR